MTLLSEGAWMRLLDRVLKQPMAGNDVCRTECNKGNLGIIGGQQCCARRWGMTMWDINL